MQKEFSEKLGFAEWYNQKQDGMERNGILKYLHRQRNISHHERPILQYPIGITEQSPASSGMNVVISGTGSSISLNSGLVAPQMIKPDTRIKYYFDDIPSRDKDVITIRQEAVNALEPIVDECEAKFQRTN